MKPEKDLITTCKTGYLFSNSITNVWKLASQEKLVTLNSPPPLHDIKQEDDNTKLSVIFVTYWALKYKTSSTYVTHVKVNMCVFTWKGWCWQRFTNKDYGLSVLTAEQLISYNNIKIHYGKNTKRLNTNYRLKVTQLLQSNTTGQKSAILIQFSSFEARYRLSVSQLCY